MYWAKKSFQMMFPARFPGVLTVEKSRDIRLFSYIVIQLQIHPNSIPRSSTPPAASGPQKMWTSPTKPWFLDECLR